MSIRWKPVIPEGDDRTPPGERRSQEVGRDVLAERRARRAGVFGSPAEAAQARRAEIAEATVDALERQLAELRRRQAEAEAEREHAHEQLVEREHELRRAKQREYAEQQLRAELQESSEQRLQDAERRREEAARGREEAERHREEATRQRDDAARRRDDAELLRKDAEQRCARAELERERAEQQRATLAMRLRMVGESCARMHGEIGLLERTVAALRTEVEQDRLAARLRVRELESERRAAAARAQELERERAGDERRIRDLERARDTPQAPGPVSVREGVSPGVAPPDASALPDAERARREEMAQALATAVERLRARAQQPMPTAVESETHPAAGRTSPPAQRPPHKHSLSLIGRWRAARAVRKQRRAAR